MIDALARLPGGPLTLAPLSLSLAVVVIVFLLPEAAVRARAWVNLGAAGIKVVVIAALVPAVLAGLRPEWRMAILPGIDLHLRVEPLSLLFAGLSSILWLLATVYAIAYLGNRPHRARFFGFFSLCVAATVGIAFSGNLVTFVIFYELLTLATYPLVTHAGSAAALRSGRIYIAYTHTGGILMLAGIAWLTTEVGSVEFTSGGTEAVAEFAARSPVAATVIFVLLAAGVGVKAALVPLHGWLPRAMVAPAPVSALLHAVAVVKAGVFGLIRIVDDVYGVYVAQDLGVLTPLLVIASVTVIYGSVLALLQKDIKARLAYSTVSQVSYVAIGISLFGVAGTTGGLVHLVHQGLMKITLFFCAGLFAEMRGVKTVAGLAGMGRRMPWTCLAFTVGAFGMIGLPPLAGFVSKWQLGIGALESSHSWVVGVLVVSAVLNSAYFLPPIYRMWFCRPDESEDSSGDGTQRSVYEPGWAPPGRRFFVEAPAALLVPALITAVLSIGVGVLAASGYAPLTVARTIAEEVYAGP